MLCSGSMFYYYSVVSFQVLPSRKVLNFKLYAQYLETGNLQSMLHGCCVARDFKNMYKNWFI